MKIFKMLFISICLSGVAAAQELQSIDVGMFSMKRGVLAFRMASGEYISDNSWEMGAAKAGMSDNHDAPGLEFVGLVAASGDRLLRAKEGKSEFVQRMTSERPNEVSRAELYKTESGDLFEVPIEGETPAIRVIIRIPSEKGGGKMYWKNITPEELQLLQKGTKKIE